MIYVLAASQDVRKTLTRDQLISAHGVIVMEPDGQFTVKKNREVRHVGETLPMSKFGEVFQDPTQNPKTWTTPER